MKKSKKQLAVALSLAMMLPSVYLPGGTIVRAAEKEELQQAVDLSDYDGFVTVDADTFPDAAFRTFIEDTYRVDEGETLNTAGITEMDLGKNNKINSLDGIWFFTDLESLDCSVLGITALDVSTLTKLKRLDCRQNALRSLDLSNNPDLEVLYCAQNGDQFSKLDVSMCEKLEVLSCAHTAVATLNVSKNSMLKYLNISNTKIATIDVSACEMLEVFDFAVTGISSIDLSRNNALKVVVEYGTALSNLDLSNHDELTDVYLGYSAENGNSEYYKEILNEEKIKAKNEKRDPDLSITNDAFSTQGEEALAAYGVTYNLFDGDCEGTLTKLDVSNCPKLKKVFCDNNKLSQIITEGSSNITELHLSKNFLTDLTVAELERLTKLKVTDNRLKALYVSNNTNLVDLFCGKNEIKTLSLDENTRLSVLLCNDNAIEAIDLSKLTKCLKEININNNKLEVLDLYQPKNTYILRFINCGKNLLTSLDVTTTGVIYQGDVKCIGNKRDVVLNSTYEFDTTSLPGSPSFRGEGSDTGILAFGEGAFDYNNAARFIPELDATEASYKYVIGQDQEGSDITCDFTLVFDPFGIVIEVASEDKDAEKIEMKGKSSNLFIGKEARLKAINKYDETKVMPPITWTSENTSVAIVDEKTGVLNCVGTGEAKIDVWVNGLKRGFVTISVTQPVEKIDVRLNEMLVNESSNTVKLKLGNNVLAEEKSVVVAADVSPANASNKQVTWSSSNPSVASVNMTTGQVTAKAGGEAIITATAKDGSNVTGSFKVEVTEYPTGISLRPAKSTIGVDMTTTVTTTINRPTANAKEVVYSTTTPSIISVDQEGNVTGLSEGEGKVVCTSVDDENIVGETTIYVKAKPEGVNMFTGEPRILANDMEFTLKLGTSKNRIQLSGSVDPADNSFPKLTWSVSDSSEEGVVAVSSGGLVTAYKVGSATIRVASVDYPDIYTECTINVEQGVTSLSVNPTSIKIYPKKTQVLKVTVFPETATNKNVEWVSDDPTIATVSETGVVTGVKPGTTRVTCKATDGSGKISACTVTILQPVTKITVKSTTTAKVFRGRQISLRATVSPENAANRNVTWKSSDKKIATVAANGVVTGVKKGTVTITCTAADGSGVKATYKVTVTEPVSKITLNKTSYTLKVKKSFTLKATVGPKSASNKAVKWSTSNKKIATVSTTGKVTAKKKGTVYITCTAADGSNVSARCLFTIK